MAVTLDLRKAHKHHRTGDLIVVLTWVNDQRALVLLPAHRRDTGWYIVDESAAYLWGVDHDDAALRREAMEHAVQQSEIACDMLGLEPSRMNRAKVISAITGWIPDLIRMPAAPLPELESGAFGEIIGKVDGKETSHEPLKRELEPGVTYG